MLNNMSRGLVGLWSLAVLALTLGSPGAGVAAELQLDAAARADLYLPAAAVDMVTLYEGKDPRPSDAKLRADAPAILKLEAAHVGRSRLLLKFTFGRKPIFDQDDKLLLYADLDCNAATGRSDSREHRGVDLMVTVSHDSVSPQYFAPVTDKTNTVVAGVRQFDNVFYMTLDAPLLIDKDKVRIRLYASSEGAGRSSSTPQRTYELPRSDEQLLPVLDHHEAPALRPLSDFRFHNNLVKLEKLADKGMTYDQVRPAHPLEFGRPRPLPSFAGQGRKPDQAGSVEREQIAVELLEETGVERHAAVASFGFPLSQGALFNLQHIRVLTPDGRETPAQFAATSFWKDDSIKWVLVDLTTPLASHAKANYIVEFGSKVRRQDDQSALKLDETGDAIIVSTGAIKVALNKKKFHLFDGIWSQAGGQLVAASAPGGVQLIDEHGTLFTTAGRPPESIRIEERGSRKIVVRVEGVYASERDEPYMRYIARLVFRADSPRVELIYTHVNDYLKTEFTDVTSLETGLVPATANARAAVSLADESGALSPHVGSKLSLFQADERHATLEADGHQLAAGCATGLLQVNASEKAPAFSAVVHDFWQRWPKGLAADAGSVRISFLPHQPGPEYGRDFPHQIMFPFVDGFYRFKWGMAFTERVTFDFSGQIAGPELLAEADQPIVPVIAADYYVRTQALGQLAAPLGRQFALWDKHVAANYRDFLRARDADRCYGYFNYGDWYGERGRNWGNNEYDFAHCFFMQFARTGNRDYFRVARAAARHQADVDCVHAYPDPFYIGGNHEHSIGHTGMWTDVPRFGTWTWRYSHDTSADNGHTWSEGMVEDWFLAGEAPVMESALALGEHIAWAMAPSFTSLGSHERSAGWSLKAIMGLYRATYDPKYLEAARRLVAVALSEQKFDDGGAWPHLLPHDHAGGHANARGNALFLIGILLQGLSDYHHETLDPALPRSLNAGAGWLLKCWDEPSQGFPYTARVDGSPLYKPATGLNAMLAGPMAYAGEVNHREDLINVAEASLDSLIHSGSSSSGKSIAQHMNFTVDLLAILQRWYATHRPDKGESVLAGGDDDTAQFLARAPDASEHSVRGPTHKVFVVRLDTSESVELLAARKPFGAAQKRALTGSIKVIDAAGNVVKQGDFSTDGPHQFSCPLGGPRGSEFKVVIEDDMRGVWNLSGKQLQIRMQTAKDFCIGGVGRGRYYFFVPPNTPEFVVRLRPGHNGWFAGVVLAPNKKPAGFYQGIHQYPKPANNDALNGPGSDHEGVALANSGQITVKPDAADTGKVWSVVLTAGGDLDVDLQGVPPYLALTADAATLMR